MTGALAKYTIQASLDSRRNVSYLLTIQRCPSKWHQGVDAISCNPVTIVEALISLCPTHPSSKDVHLSDTTVLATIQGTMNTSDNNATMTPDHIWALGWNDQSCTNFINSINQRFPSKCSLTEPDIYNFCEVWHQLSTKRDLVLMEGGIVIPKSLRRKVLYCQHSAHQSVNSMKACTNDSVYWPGMNASICNFRANCSICATFASSQPWEPITMTPSPNGLSSK